MNVGVTEALHHWLAEESDWGVTILQGFQSQGGLTDCGEQRLRLSSLSGLLGGEELILKRIQLVKRGEEFQATAIVQFLAFRRGRLLSVTERPMPGLEAWLLPRIDKLRRRLELRWCSHGTLNKRELSKSRDTTSTESQCRFAKAAAVGFLK